MHTLNLSIKIFISILNEFISILIYYQSGRFRPISLLLEHLRSTVAVARVGMKLSQPASTASRPIGAECVATSAGNADCRFDPGSLKAPAGKSLRADANRRVAAGRKRANARTAIKCRIRKLWANFLNQWDGRGAAVRPKIMRHADVLNSRSVSSSRSSPFRNDSPQLLKLANFIFIFHVELCRGRS